MAVVSPSRVTLSSKGQVVIPREIREALGLGPGSELLITARADGSLELKPMRRSITSVFGRLRRDGQPPLTVEEMDEAIAQAIVEENCQ